MLDLPVEGGVTWRTLRTGRYIEFYINTNSPACAPGLYFECILESKCGDQRCGRDEIGAPEVEVVFDCGMI